MKKILLLLLLVFNITSCGVSRLTDSSLTRFSAIATQGDFSNKVKVSWSINAYFKSYQVYRSVSEFGDSYIPISDRLSDPFFEDTKLVPGQIYFYQVVGYNHEDAPIFKADPVCGFAGISADQPPADVKTEKGASSKEIRLTWSPVSTAVSYSIYRALPGENFVFIDRSDYTFYSDTTALPGVVYFYRVSSVNEVDFESVPSQPVEGLRFGVNNNIQASDGTFSDKIVVEWDPAFFANEYNIYRSFSSNYPPQFLKQTKNTIFEDTDPLIPSGDNVLYWIQAVSEIGSLSDLSRIEIGYKRKSGTLNAPEIPNSVLQNIQGQSKTQITLQWNAMSGVSKYNIYRASQEKGEYQLFATTASTEFIDTPNSESYTYFYSISAVNSYGEGARTKPIEGWILRAPFNITSTLFFSDKIELRWSPVKNAKGYFVYSSDSETGSYSKSQLLTEPYFVENISLGSLDRKQKFYKVSVLNDSDLESDPSQVIVGAVQKIQTPRAFQILNNRTSKHKYLSLSWDFVDGATKYRVYRATFKHRFETISDLSESRYTLITELDNTSKFYNDPLPQIPLRRYAYKVSAVNDAGEESLKSSPIEGYRLPNDINEFIRDVDYSIYYTQYQINNFGSIGVAAVVKGRGGGCYDYSSQFSSIRNNWLNLTQFEITLDGNPRMDVIINPAGSAMNGPVNVSGIYKGSIEYIGVQALAGGTVAAGSIKAVYHNPSKGVEQTTRSVADLNVLMITIRIGNDPPYSPPGAEALP
ncbi:MAG: fibronectin type III domain-containing protein [Brevinemataceae bacterium]